MDDFRQLLPLLLTFPLLKKSAEFVLVIWPAVLRIAEVYLRFQQPITPQATYEFEQELMAALRELGRVLLEWKYNHLEGDAATQAPFVRYQGVRYRWREKKGRHWVATLAGKIQLWAWIYESPEPREPCIRPLDWCLGLQAGCATPALAEQVGCWMNESGASQRRVLRQLRKFCNVFWSAQTLRNVTATLSDGLAMHRHAAQVAQLLKWLEQAHATAGPHRVTLSAGRDGYMVPIRGQKEHREASTAMVTVLDRCGKRMVTVYLAQMPDLLQCMLSEQLTGLLRAVLEQWTGEWPELQYVTDGGFHATQYYQQVLSCWPDPRHRGRVLRWKWVVDFYHAAQRIGDLGEALFRSPKERAVWVKEMLRRMRKRNGMRRVLLSAAAHYGRRRLSAVRREAYWEAYNYLSSRLQFLDYWSCKKRGMLIGSGITEAACKMIGQRIKCSGMKWGLEGGQVILELMVLQRSQVWCAAFGAYLKSLPLPTPESRTSHPKRRSKAKKAA